jgi:hypothetical protein
MVGHGDGDVIGVAFLYQGVYTICERIKAVGAEPTNPSSGLHPVVNLSQVLGLRIPPHNPRFADCVTAGHCGEMREFV